MKTYKLFPHSYDYPFSRDYGMDYIPCKRSSCVNNINDECVVPTKCKIGENGLCEGFFQKYDKS